MYIFMGYFNTHLMSILEVYIYINSYSNSYKLIIISSNFDNHDFEVLDKNLSSMALCFLGDL